MQTNPKAKLSITGLFIQDPDDKGYTGFFNELPEAVAEGDTIEEAVENLFLSLQAILEAKKEIIKEELLLQDEKGTIAKTFEFELA